MSLRIQFLSFIVSFVFGFFLNILINFFSNLIYSKNIYLKIFSTIVFCLINSMLYFWILLKINYGYVHIYFLLLLLLGMFMCKVLKKLIVKKKL